MFIRIKSLVATLLALALLGVVACGGGNSGGDEAGTSPPARDDDGSASADNGAVDDDLFVSNGVEVLAKSAQSFESEGITSAQGLVEFDFAMGTMAVSGTAHFGYQSPDQMYMTMEFEGGDSQSLVDLSELGNVELLVRDGKVFMNIPFLGGWFVMDPGALGADPSVIQDMLSRGSLFDYSGFIQSARTDGASIPIEFVGEEDVEGVATAHYRVTGELTELIGAFSDALSATGDTGFSQQILNTQLSGPVVIDLWVGMEDYLPYKMAATAEFQAPEGSFGMTLSGRFFGYNEPANIPAAPANAQNFADLFGGMIPTQ